MEFSDYRWMMVGCSVVLFVFLFSVLMVLPKRILAEMIEKFFDITRLDHRTFMMDFFGHHVDLLSSRRFRFSVIIQLADITCIAFLLLLDGCSMQVHYLTKKDMCPTGVYECFTFGKGSTHERMICSSGESLVNATSSKIVCFLWVYAEQNALSILNQIGICSSVFSLLCHSFKIFCRLSRKCWGLILLILLVLALITIVIIAFTIDLAMSMTAKLLCLSLSCLLINVIQLVQFSHHWKSHHHSVPLTK